MVFVDTEREIETDPDLKDFDVRLLMWLARRMTETNEVRLKQKEIAEALKTRTARISESMTRLRNAGYVTTEYAVIRIDPKYFWRDSIEKNSKLI